MVLTVYDAARPEHRRWRLKKPPEEYAPHQKQPQSTGEELAKIRKQGEERGSYNRQTLVLE